MSDLARSILRPLAAPAVLAAALAGCGSAQERYGGFQFESRDFQQVDALDLAKAETAPARPLAEVSPVLEDAKALAPPYPERLEIPLDEVRATVLENNLDVRAQLIAPSIAAADLAAEEAKFESTFFVNYQRSDASLITNLDQGLPANTDQANVGVRVPLATGGEIVVDAPLVRADQQLSPLVGDELWQSQLGFSISQPFLRGGWFDATMNSIRISRYQGQIVEAQTKLSVIRVLAAADRAYWNLYAAWGELEVRRTQYELAVRQLEAARRRVAAGDAPELEVVRAESGVGRTVEAIIIADALLRNRQREIKKLLNRPDLPIESETGLVPRTTPSPVELSLDPGILSDSAVRNRMEMLELELQLAVDASTIAFRRNQALPLFLFDFDYSFQGQGSSAPSSYDNIFDGDFYQLGLSAEIPIGNEAAEARLRSAILARIQRLATRDARRQSIRAEVLEALDKIRQSWQRILAARLETVLAARTLEGEQRQFEVGIRTSTDVLDAAAQLANAQSREVRALADWQIALVDLAFATGTTLGGARVAFEGDEDPE